MGWEFVGYGIKISGFIIRRTLFYLIKCFSKAIFDVDVHISWLAEVRNHLDEAEKEQAKTKRKRLPKGSI